MITGLTLKYLKVNRIRNDTVQKDYWLTSTVFKTKGVAKNLENTIQKQIISFTKYRLLDTLGT